MMLAPGWRNRMTSTAGLPLDRPALRRFSTESWTSATSRQPHRGAVAVGDDQRLVVRRVRGLVVGVELVVQLVAVSIAPFGLLALAEASAARTSSSPMPYLNSAFGFSSTRTAGSAAPPMMTWPMPLICDSFCDSTLLAASYIWPRVRVFEVSARIRTGASAGLTLR